MRGGFLIAPFRWVPCSFHVIHSFQHREPLTYLLAAQRDPSQYHQRRSGPLLVEPSLENSLLFERITETLCSRSYWFFCFSFYPLNDWKESIRKIKVAEFGSHGTGPTENSRSWSWNIEREIKSHLALIRSSDGQKPFPSIVFCFSFPALVVHDLLTDGGPFSTHSAFGSCEISRHLGIREVLLFCCPNSRPSPQVPRCSTLSWHLRNSHFRLDSVGSS